MSRLVISLGLLIAQSVACAGDDHTASTHVQQRDAGAAGASASGSIEQDAGPRGDVDLHALLIATLIETEATLIARCPCLTASGTYETMAQCMEAVSLGRKWVDCANGLDLSAHDDAATRASFRCAIEESKQRSQCLMGSACSDDDVVACMTETRNCDKLPVELLSEFAVQCQVAFSR